MTMTMTLVRMMLTSVGIVVDDVLKSLLWGQCKWLYLSLNRLYTILQIHICDSSSPLPNNDQQDQGYYFDRNGALVGLARALGHLLLLSNVEITRWPKSTHWVQFIASKTTATGSQSKRTSWISKAALHILLSIKSKCHLMTFAFWHRVKVSWMLHVVSKLSKKKAPLWITLLSAITAILQLQRR